MKYRCPICNGKGTVEPDFGRGATGGICPGCDGTGIQWKNESVSYPPIVTPIELKQRLRKKRMG